MKTLRQNRNKGKIPVVGSKNIWYNNKNYVQSLRLPGLEWNAMNEKHRRSAPAPVEEIEGQLEGRNALTEALRSGRTIDKVFIAAGDTDRAKTSCAAYRGIRS